MHRKVFIAILLWVVATGLAHGQADAPLTDTATDATKQVFKAKLRAAWAEGLVRAPDVSGRLAKQGMATDGLSTIASLSGGAVELNPLLGTSPSALTLVGFTAVKFMHVDRINNDNTQRAQDRANHLCTLAALGDAATSNNIALLVGASTGVPLLIGAVVANTRYKDCMQSAKRAYLTEVAPALWAEAQQAVRLQR